MTLRRILWLVMILVTLTALALLVPASPAYLPALLVRHGHMHEGHGTGYWMDAMNSPDLETRQHAIFSLGTIGADAEEAVPALADIMLNDPDDITRAEASQALAKMTPASRSAVPALAQALGDSYPFVRMNAANALFKLQKESGPAIPALLMALKSKDNLMTPRMFTLSIQGMVALALARATSGTALAVPALLDALHSADSDLARQVFVRALGYVGTSAREAGPDVAAFCKAENPDLRQAAEQALREIGAEAKPE